MKAVLFNIQKFSLHDGPGIRTSLFFSRCNLRCKWCANPECVLENNPLSNSKEYDEQELLTEVLKDKAFYDKSGGGITLTGGEVFLQFAFASKFCRLAKEQNISVVIETAGAVDAVKFKELVDLVDFVYLDCKHYDGIKHKEGTGIVNQQILQNMAWLAQSGKAYCIRIPVIPGYNNSLLDAREFCRLFSSMSIRHVELLPFHQLGENKYRKYQLDYAFAGIKQLHTEDLLSYRQVFADNNISVVLGSN